MNQTPTAFSLFRLGLARMLDTVGVLWLIWLGCQVMFGGSQPFEDGALWVGSIGVAACLFDQGARRNLPIAMLAYVGWALTSAVAHQWPVVSTAEGSWLALFTPAVHLVVMALFVLGVAHLLRTPSRLSLGVVLLVASIGMLGVQIVFDRVSTNFAYIRGGSASMPSVSQWGGLHQIGMLLVLAVPFPLAMAATSRSAWPVAAGLVLAGGFLIAALVNGSSGGIVAIVLVGAVMAAGVAAMRFRGRSLQLFLVVPVVLGIGGLLFAVFTGQLSVLSRGDLVGRVSIWQAAAAMWRDHFWFGAGPGQYSTEMATVYAEQYLPRFNNGGVLQAHNLLLQAAAETGLFGALSLAVWLLWTLRACWLAWVRGNFPMIALGLLFAIFGFSVRSMTDNFMDGLVTTDRIRVLVWTLFAAALAVSRLPLNPVPGNR